MTSLGLTFHSRPTPALCILTSLRCVSYILYLTPPLSLVTSPTARSFPHRTPPVHTIAQLSFFKNEKEEKTVRCGRVVSRPNNPRLAGPRGYWTLASSHFCQQMQRTVTWRFLIILIRIVLYNYITKISHTQYLFISNSNQYHFICKKIYKTFNNIQ